MWLIFFALRGVWASSYMVSYVRTDVLGALLREDLQRLFLLGSRAAYTVCSIKYLPEAWNVVFLLEELASVAFHLSNDSAMVFFRLRQTRETYQEYFVPSKGCHANLQFFFLGLLLVWDVCRHLTMLYAKELALGRNGAENFMAIEQSPFGRAYSVSLRDGVNAFYTASIIFQARVHYNSRAGIGLRVEGTRRVMINSK